MAVVILSIVLIALAVEKFVPRQPMAGASVTKAMAAPPADPMADMDSRRPLYIILHQATKDLAFPRDPFNPAPLVPADGPVQLNLMGIVWDQKKPSAIINNEIVQIGSTIANHIVVDIQENKVIVNDGSSDLELTIPEF